MVSFVGTSRRRQFCHHFFVCLSFTLYIYLTLDFFLFYCLIYLELYWMSLLFISLLAKITRSHSTGRQCQEDNTLFTVCVFVRESLHECMSPCMFTSLCALKCVCVCVRCSAPFPTTGYVQGLQLCCQDVFKSFLQEHLLCFLSVG